MLNGNTITVMKDQISTFHLICIEIGNDELLSFVKEDLTASNALGIIEIKYKSSKSIAREVEFIASHFFEFGEERMSSLDVTILDSILSSKSLVIKSEHSLFSFICDLITSHGNEYRALLSHMHLEYLDQPDIIMFVNYIDDDNVGCLLPCIYRRLLCSSKLKITEDDSHRYTSKFIDYNDDIFDGIFSSLWKEAGRNPVACGVVDITETENWTQSAVTYLVDPENRYRTNWFYRTRNTEGASFTIDFKDKKVSLNGYSLKASPQFKTYQEFLKAWKIEGSNDKKTWSIIDEQVSDVLQTFMAEGSWECQESPPFRFFRIMMTDTNTSGSHVMSLHAIEFFGTIFYE